MVDYTAEKSQSDVLKKEVEAFAKSCPDGEGKPAVYDFTPRKFSEGYKTSAKVQYVAKAGTYRCDELQYTGALKVLKVIMGYEYLWNQVRVVGGAYGCFGSFTRNGKVTFASYRDPNLRRTLEIYDKAVEYLEGFDVSERDMTKFIIGTVSDLDFPLTPSSKGSRSHDAFLCGDSFEKIQKERDEILGCTSKDISALSKYIKKMKDDECICVLGGEEEIEKEKDLFDRTESLFLK
jgi:Zn-dependent M16 (insulinase) family peptidase